MKQPKFNSNILISNQKLNEPWPGIVEWDITGRYTDREGHQEMFCRWEEKSLERADTIMRKLYKEILIKDPLWHFINEGNFNVLRVSEKFRKPVERFLKNHSLLFKYKGYYGKDNQCGTEMFQKVFTYLFHGFSVLAMESTRFDFSKIQDRVYHVFNLSNIANAFEGKWGDNWESRVIMDNALGRSQYMGFCMAYDKMRRDQEKKK